MNFFEKLAIENQLPMEGAVNLGTAGILKRHGFQVSGIAQDQQCATTHLPDITRNTRAYRPIFSGNSDYDISAGAGGE